jgi:hypothetical protein
MKSAIYRCLPVIIGVWLGSPLPGQVAEDDLSQYEDALNKALYDGWSLSRVDNTITIKRDSKVRAVHKENPNLHPDKDGNLGIPVIYTISLTFHPKLDEQAYALQQLKLLALAQRISSLQETLNTMKQVGDTYYPANEEEQEVVRVFNQLKEQIPVLPTHYDSRNSVIIDSGDFAVIGPDSVECLRMESRIKRFFKSYAPHSDTQVPGGVTIRMTAHQALNNLTVDAISYRNASLGDILGKLNDGLYVAMGRRISPVIRTEELPERTLSQSVTISGNNKMTAKELLDLLCGLYEMKYSIRHNQIQMESR